jgi:hypothetical protein
MEDQRLMSCRTASGGGGGFRSSGSIDQNIAKCVQIRDGSYNAGSHYRLNVNATLSKQRGGIWALMPEGQRRHLTDDPDIEPSHAKGFWDIIRVYCLRLLGVRHD